METDTKLYICFVTHTCLSFWQACMFHQTIGMDFLGIVVGVLMFATGVAFATYPKKLWYTYLATASVIVSTGLSVDSMVELCMCIPLVLDFFSCLLLSRFIRISNKEDEARENAERFAQKELERRLSGK